MKALPAFAACLLLCACAKLPEAAPPREAAPARDLVVLDVKPPRESAPPVAGTPTTNSDPGACLSARFEGPVGNCIEPSLLVTDSCTGREFAFGFNDCIAARYDERLLAIDGPPLIGVSVHDTTRHVSLGEVTAVRGRIARHDQLVVGPLSYNLEVDVVEGGRQTTTRLVGAVP